MDENQIGPNISTTLGQWDVIDGTCPVGKAVCLQLKGGGFIPSEVSLKDPWQDQDPLKTFFCGFFGFFLCFDFVPFVGTPENAGVM